jgi:SAM-dependent methyltransferase
MRVAPGNTEQAVGWDGEQGRFWAANADRLDLLVAGYDADLFDAAGLARTDRVLDIGCGTGSVTLQAALRAWHGSALGVDLSAAMLATARARAAAKGVPNVRFEQCDAQLHAFGDGQFDAVLSRTGTMFFADPVAAFANLGRALRPGGRLTMLTWQEAGRNPWVTDVATVLTGGPGAIDTMAGTTDGPGPFSLSNPAVIADVLGRAGLIRVQCRPLKRPMHYGGDVTDAEQFVLGMAGWMLQGQSPQAQQRARARLRTVLAERTGPAGVTLGSAAWLTTAER